MKYAHSHLQSALCLVDEYKAGEPFSSFAKKYFSRHKKYGSRDRKEIRHLCYCFFRMGKALTNLPVEERMLMGLFLCSTKANGVLEQLKPHWNAEVRASFKEKLTILNIQPQVFDVFPWREKESPGIDHDHFSQSFFIQPDLFLRLRPGHESDVKEKLKLSGIDFSERTPACLALPNNSGIESIIDLDREAVVQDYNSQKTAGILQRSMTELPGGVSAWDCCAGSGGKSLLLYDIDPTINLTVSDVRKAILVNLEKRFSRAGIKKFRKFLVDLTRPHLLLPGADFNLIICDAPCTGSGTWSRTPEQLCFFDEKKIDDYSSLQKKIVSNVIAYLRKDGFFLYITCSVFKNENEEVVSFIRNELRLELIQMKVLTGYDEKADTLFTSLFRK